MRVALSFWLENAATSIKENKKFHTTCLAKIGKMH